MNAKNWFFVAGGSVGLWILAMGNHFTGLYNGWILLTANPVGDDFTLGQANLVKLITFVLIGIAGYAIYRALKSSNK